MIKEVGPVHFYGGGSAVGGAAFTDFWSIILYKFVPFYTRDSC